MMQNEYSYIHGYQRLHFIIIPRTPQHGKPTQNDAFQWLLIWHLIRLQYYSHANVCYFKVADSVHNCCGNEQKKGTKHSCDV